MAQLEPSYLPEQDTAVFSLPEKKDSARFFVCSFRVLYVFFKFFCKRILSHFSWLYKSTYFAFNPVKLSFHLVIEKLLTTVVTASTTTNQTKVCLWCNVNCID